MSRTDRRDMLVECRLFAARALELADVLGSEMPAAWLAQALAALDAEIAGSVETN